MNKIKEDVQVLLDNKVKEIIATVETLRDLKEGSLNSKSRRLSVALPRQVVSNFLMNELNVKIGLMNRYINRDRTNFYYMQELHEKVIKNFHFYPEYHKLYHQLKAIYYGNNKKVAKKHLALVMELKQKKEKQVALANDIQKLEDQINVELLKTKLC